MCSPRGFPLCFVAGDRHLSANSVHESESLFYWKRIFFKKKWRLLLFRGGGICEIQQIVDSLYHFRLIILSLDINYALIETAIWRMEFFLYYFILPIFFTEKWYLKVRIHTFYRDYVRKVLSSINSE